MDLNIVLYFFFTLPIDNDNQYPIVLDGTEFQIKSLEQISSLGEVYPNITHLSVLLTTAWPEMTQHTLLSIWRSQLVSLKFINLSTNDSIVRWKSEVYPLLLKMPKLRTLHLSIGSHMARPAEQLNPILKQLKCLYMNVAPDTNCDGNLNKELGSINKLRDGHRYVVELKV